MSDRRNVVYLYDGSFEGLLTVIFECYALHEFPYNIERTEFNQQTLDLDYIHIQTDSQKANRVIKKVEEVSGKTEMKRIYRCFLSEQANIELVIFNYVRACLKFGTSVSKRLTVDCVNTIVNLARSVGGEAHQYTGFVRFCELENGVYYGAIEPKNDVLPLLIPHFVQRYRNIPFIIHDTTRNRCIVYNCREYGIYDTESLPVLKLSQNEQSYRALWKSFYDTIAIKERENESCRMSHLPKRFRRCMTEFL